MSIHISPSIDLHEQLNYLLLVKKAIINGDIDLARKNLNSYNNLSTSHFTFTKEQIDSIVLYQDSVFIDCIDDILNAYNALHFSTLQLVNVVRGKQYLLSDIRFPNQDCNCVGKCEGNCELQYMLNNDVIH
jgi:hypothetical protein